jgi:tRNA 2-thiouridine synthesizing protein A
VTYGEQPLDRDASSLDATGGRATGVPDVLDCRGQRCPLPVIALARRVPAVPVGTVVRVLADDPAAANDIPAWCRLRGQEFLGAVEADGATGFDVRRVT